MQNSILYIAVLLVGGSFVLCQQKETNCILNLQLPETSPDNSSCEGGNWGGFLQNSCCRSVFHHYLNGLARQGNQIGLIFLNSSEQSKCLISMKSYENDVFGCGIEKLTAGGGGCSEFSVFDVKNRLGHELKSLDENCRVLDLDGDWDGLCGSCVRSWREIGSLDLGNGDGFLLKVESDICRFAVLVSLMGSKVEDEMYGEKVYKCLGEQKLETENQDPEDKSKKRISTGIWILIAGLIGFIVIASLTFIPKRCYKANLPMKKKIASPSMILKESGCLRVPLKEVYSATNNLNELNFIGEGTSGKVYQGILSSNQHVAIKHLINDKSIETSAREITNLSKIRHPNLVTLLGCCIKGQECFLVYELCPNGNLSEWLFGMDKVLSWIQRLNIAIDIGRGLSFLHTYPQGCIVHRDIKPTNILLGANFKAKLSDFGLSKVINLGETQVSSEVRGTFGYLDPEYQNNHHVNSSVDVYSFGIVLLQILSAKRVINLNLKTPIPLNKMAKVLGISEFADSKLHGEYSIEAFELTLQLALSCTSLKEERPSMEQVVLRLRQALDISTSSFASTPYMTIHESKTENSF